MTSVIRCVARTYLLSNTVWLTRVVDKACPITLGSRIDKSIWFNCHKVVVSMSLALVTTYTSSKLREINHLSNVLDDERIPENQKASANKYRK